MDRQSLALLIPILALSIPVLAVLFAGMTKLARVRAEQGRGADPELEDRVAALERETEALRHELLEAHERLDFAERLLAKPGEGSPARRSG